jgi:hypothetical protein
MPLPDLKHGQVWQCRDQRCIGVVIHKDGSTRVGCASKNGFQYSCSTWEHFATSPYGLDCFHEFYRSAEHSIGYDLIILVWDPSWVGQ